MFTARINTTIHCILPRSVRGSFGNGLVSRHLQKFYYRQAEY
jgi:hypothetical protein